MSFVLKYKYVKKFLFFPLNYEREWHFQSEDIWSAIQTGEKIIEKVDQKYNGYFVLHQIIHIKTKRELRCGM